MKNKPNNPFLVWGYHSPKYFCDRELETQTIIAALQNGRNISLISPRRIGKTGLIQHVFSRVKNQNPEIRCFYLDIFSTENLYDFTLLLSKTILGNLDSFSQKIMRTITSFFTHIHPVFTYDSLSGMPKLSVEISSGKAEDGLKEIFEYLKKSSYICYIAIDEFQQITNYPENGIEGLLRSYIQFLPNVRFIFSGSKKHLMDAIFSSANRPFYQSTQKMGLKAIPRDTYYTFAKKIFIQNGLKLSNETFNYIYDHLLGHTWYIQVVLNHLYELNKKESEIADVDSIIEKILQEETATYMTYCEMITKGQLRLLRAVAKENVVSSPFENSFMKRHQLSALSSVKLAINALIDKSLLLKDEDNSYIVYDRFFSFWLAKR